MSQHDYNIANDSGLGVRTDLNALFMAIATQNSGDSEPNPTYPLQWWADTLTGYLKQRNVANDAWQVRWDLTKGQLATLYSPTFGGQVNLPTTTFINGNAVATLVAPNFSGNAVFEKLTAWSDVSLPASTTIGGVSATELSYLDGVTSSIQTQLNALSSGKQATLVSGTNIKTVNGNSLLGSGNITISPNVSGVFANSKEFTASGTFTVPAGVTKIMTYIAGAGGGGGGGGIGVGSSNNGGEGGGGGAAAFYPPIIIATSPGATFTVTIGSGGSGGASNSGAGGTGGTTSFGSFTVYGGTGGGGGAAGVTGTTAGSGGGAGASPGAKAGVGGTGGASGGTETGIVTNVYTRATGGSTTVGEGGRSNANDGANGTVGLSSSPYTGGAGGAGGSGKVIVYW